MAITLEPTNIRNALREKNFTLTLTANGTFGEIVNSVTATLQGEAEPNIVITPGVKTVTISGYYQKGFSDFARYVETSTKIETPITVTSLTTIPPNKVLFEYRPSQVTNIVKTYSVIVTYDTTSTQNFLIEQKVFNDIRSYTPYIQSYYGNTNPEVFYTVWSNDAGERIQWLNSSNRVVQWRAD